MPAYVESGNLLTDKRTVDDEETWDSQAEWEAAQEQNGVAIVNGSLQLAESTIPDSVVEQFNAQELTGFSDGNTVSAFSGVLGNFDATGGGATYRPSAINGHAALEFSGSSSDAYDADGLNQPTPDTIIAVVNAGNVSSTNQAVFDSIGDSSHSVYWNNSEWGIISGSKLNGSSDTSVQLLAGVFGSSGELYEGDTQTASGDTGSTALSGLRIGDLNNSLGPWPDDIGFIEVHDGLPSNGLQTRISEVANMWSITL